MTTDRRNPKCKDFPCHDPQHLEDCTFCYCPLYPCERPARGGYYLDTPDGRIWACEKCLWIHKKEVVDDMLKLLWKTYKDQP